MSTRKLTAGILLSLLGAGAAWAQAPAGTQVQRASAAQNHAAEARADKQIDQLHDRLKITPAQQDLWNDFANTRRDNAQHFDQVLQQGVPRDKQTALDGMRTYARITQTQAEDMQKLLPKFEALYDALTPQQKQVADQTFAEYRNRMHQNMRKGS